MRPHARRTRVRAAVTALATVPATLLALTAGAPAAGAATATFTDPAGDRGADITRVRVNHAARLNVTVAHARRLSLDDRYTFWIHTTRGADAPSYRVTVIPNSGGIRLDRVQTYGGRGRQVTCPRLSAQADVYADSDVAIRVPRVCIGKPRGVAVTVRMNRAGAGQDWAPATRTPSPWVRHG